MSDLEIVIGDDFQVSESIITTFYLDYKGYCFPDNKWIDFTEAILSAWTNTLFKNRNVSDAYFRLNFMDGPFWLDVAKNQNMQLTIDCINDRQNRFSELQFIISYQEFLSVLYKAYKSLNRILYETGRSKDRFEATYNYTITSMKQLKQEIQIL